MIDRRHFLKLSAGAALGGLYALDSGGSSFAAARGLDRIGVQLYTVRGLMAEDFAGTLEAVAEVGYDEVEFAGYFDHDPSEVRVLLDRVGLAAPAAHLPKAVFAERLEEVIVAAEVIGHRYLVLPWLAPDERQTIAQYEDLASFANRIGATCRDAGLAFGYHNHDFELEPIGGKVPLDLLLEETDPELVTFELDLYWVTKGGGDPLDYIDRYPGRFRLCHVKDMAPDGTMVDVGSGAIDFAAIFAAAETAGLEHYFVEHDEPTDPIESITRSYRHLDSLTL